MAVTIHTAEDIAHMRVACRLASEVLDYITPFVTPGVTTGKLNELCHAYMRDVQGTVPAPLNYAPPGYPPFPASICSSVNDVICHGIPGDKVLKSGDIVNLDITVITKEGYYGDTSRTFVVGEGSILAKRLTQVTFECMWKGIAAVRPGARLAHHACLQRCPCLPSPSSPPAARSPALLTTLAPPHAIALAPSPSINCSRPASLVWSASPTCALNRSHRSIARI